MRESDYPVNSRRVTALQGAVFAAAAAGMLFAAGAPALDLFSPFKHLLGGSEGIIVWHEAGQFVKIADQDWDRDKRRAPPNSHPAEVKPGELAATLASLMVTGPEHTPAERKFVPIFTPDEVSELAVALSRGLARATPQQDVVFAVTGAAGKGGRLTTGGRAFVKDGLLNIIFGDVLQPAKNSDNESEYAPPHRAGKRAEVVDHSVQMGTGHGIAYWRNVFGERSDWIMINVPVVAATYHGPTIPMAGGVNPDAAPATEKARQVQEQERMREEMARVRKQMLEKDSGNAPPAPATAAEAPATPAAAPPPASAPKPAEELQGAAAGEGSVEARLTTLKRLHDRKLITDEEYAAKRKTILEQL